MSQGTQPCAHLIPPGQDGSVVSQREPGGFAQLTLESVFAVCSDAIFVTGTEGVIRSSNPKAIEFVRLSEATLSLVPITTPPFRSLRFAR